jgi:hypothetical protein
MLTQLSLLQSCLDEDSCIYLLACDPRSNTPDRVVATSDSINTQLNGLLYYNKQTVTSALIKVLSPPSAEIHSHMHSQCTVEIVAMPAADLRAFVAEKLGLPDTEGYEDIRH